MVSPRLAAITALSIGAFLGLAIVGAGGAGRFFSQPPLAALAAATVVLGLVSLFSEAQISPGVSEDRSNRWVIPALGALGVACAFLPAYTDRHNVLTFGGESLRWAGVALFVAGGILRLAPIFVLGRRFSGLVAVQTGHSLVTGGLYGVIRHPSYLGLIVNSLGWALAFRSLVGVVIVALMLFVILRRIDAEERFLGENFGAEYEAYRARTWRLAPYLY
jgi:protein-S-isoprenylcysteine O-methyltransferase Ste14